MRAAIYPGSFNPMHRGHNNIVNEGLRIFDKVIIAVGINPAKPPTDIATRVETIKKQWAFEIAAGRVDVVCFATLLADYVREENKNQYNIHAVIKGIRNTSDFEEEKVQLYHNQDLSLGIPTLYMIANRDVQHVSSTAIRTIEAMRK